MEELILFTSRALEPIDRILNNFRSLMVLFFRPNNNLGFMRMLMGTILSNEYLLISVSLVIIGFVIAILKRIINV